MASFLSLVVLTTVDSLQAGQGNWTLPESFVMRSFVELDIIASVIRIWIKLSFKKLS